MSYAMTHLAIAKEVNDLLDIAVDLPQFYIGSIAPDSVHFRDNYNGEMKKKSHYCPNIKPWGNISTAEECNQWLDYALQKLKAQKKPHTDFYWGCFIHIISDVWNTRENFIHYKNWCTRENVPADAYFSEQKNVDQTMYKTVPWRDEVWKYLSEAHGESFNTVIKANEVEKYKDYIFSTCNNGIVEPVYSKVLLTIKSNNNFIKRSAQAIANLVCDCQG